MCQYRQHPLEKQRHWETATYTRQSIYGYFWGGVFRKLLICTSKQTFKFIQTKSNNIKRYIYNIRTLSENI